MRFLDFIIIPTGIEIKQEKVKTVLEWPEPKNVKQVQEFLKFTNFYRKFIGNYASNLASIINLFKKNVLFN